MTDAPASKPIFLTGATGYIAKHITLRLLNAGYHVRGSARSVERTQEMHDALKPPSGRSIGAGAVGDRGA